MIGTGFGLYLQIFLRKRPGIKISRFKNNHILTEFMHWMHTTLNLPWASWARVAHFKRKVIGNMMSGETHTCSQISGLIQG